MEETWKELLELVENAKPDANKWFEAQNKAAATRLRKSLQGVKNLCQDLRIEIQEEKNSL